MASYQTEYTIHYLRKSTEVKGPAVELLAGARRVLVDSEVLFCQLSNVCKEIKWKEKDRKTSGLF